MFENSDFVNAAVSAIGVYFIYTQLKAMNEANKFTGLMAILSLEESVAKSRADLANSIHEMALIDEEDKNKKKNDPNHQESIAIQLAQLKFKEKREQYLNAMDRLCSCIIRGYVNEDKFRQDYRNGIADTVKQHTSMLGPDSRHKNILRVHDAWSQDKTAVEK